jgi:nicotinamide-nucleotide amidase
MPRISFITIGNELLKGRIINTNAAKVGAMLRQHGYALDRVVTISDEGEAIRQAVAQEWANHEVVLLSGGLGPTRDDITKHTLATWFGSRLEMHAPTLVYLEERYAARGRVLNARTRDQALAPVDAEVIPNPKGTAPALAFARDGKWLVAMPGVPFELLYLIEAEVIPRLKQRYAGELFRQRVFRLGNVSESEVALQMDALEDQLPSGLSIAYLPRADGLWLELNLCCVPEELVAGEGALEKTAAQVRERFRDRIYADTDLDLAHLVVDRCAREGHTLAVAEQLSQGQLGIYLSEADPTAAVYLGGQLLPQKQLLGENEAGSEALARQLAKTIREQSGTTYGLATYARAGEREACIVVDSAQGSQLSRMLLLSDRQENRQRSAWHALQLVWKKLNQAFE